MNKNEEQQFTMLLNQLENEQNRRVVSDNNNIKSMNYNGDGNKNIVELQLDLEKIKMEIKNDLLGKERKIINGNEIYVDCSDERNRIWSDYGVTQIMSLINSYVNPNTLLSFYREEEIPSKMFVIANELTDLIFCQLELFLHYPSPEQLYERYISIADKHKIPYDKDELYLKCIKWSEDEMRAKENNFPMTIIKITDIIHSTYKRALNGEERDSLRKQMMISQNLQNNQLQMPMQKGGLIK